MAASQEPRVYPTDPAAARRLDVLQPWTPGRALAALPQIARARSSAKFRLDLADRVGFYARNTYGPTSFLGPAVGAALTQWVTGNPREWGQGFGGYGRRLASGYSRNVIANSIALPIAAFDHEDPRYFPSNRRGIWPRAQYALVHAFVVRNEAGREMPAYSRIIGAYGAGFASNTWYPRSSADTKHALYRGSTALASSMAYTVLLEFWPDAMRLMHLRR
jgi:hypothetical protein